MLFCEYMWKLNFSVFDYEYMYQMNVHARLGSAEKYATWRPLEKVC